MFSQRKDELAKREIDLVILDDKEFLSPFCADEPIISQEVSSYIDNALETILPKEKIIIYLKSNIEDKTIQQTYIKSIKNYYQNRYYSSLRKLRINRNISLIMFILGLIFVCLTMFCTYLKINEIYLIVLEIISWVFIWEAVDKFAFERTKNRIDYHRSMQVMNAEIIFKKR